MTLVDDAIKAHQERERLADSLSDYGMARQALVSVLGRLPELFSKIGHTEWRAEHEGMSFRVTKWAGEEYHCFLLSIYGAWHPFNSLHELGRMLDAGTVRLKGQTAKIIERDVNTE